MDRSRETPRSRRSERGTEKQDLPVECLWGNGPEAIPLLPPGTPRGVFEADAVGDFVLETGHVAPGAPNVLFAPFMGEIVDLTAGKV